jgi:RNA polymerase sigma-70 factor (ECF subfamily)
MTDEQDWIAALARGDERTIERFDTRFRPRLIGLARKRGLGTADAEDVAQAAIADALHAVARGTFRGQSALSSWLHSIVQHKIADHWRKLPPAFVPVSDDHRIVATSQADVLLVRQILEQMDGLDRFVLVSHESHGRTLEEIGALVGLKKSAVGERLERARRRFRSAVLGDVPSPQLKA